MSFYGNDENKQKLITRLNRIEGQIRGINNMITQDRDCIEILNQISSSQAALKGLWKEVVRGHLQTCLKDALKHDTKPETLIDELVSHLDKMK